MRKKFASLLDTIRTLVRLPTAHLEFQTAKDPGNVERIFRHFTKRHPRFLLIGNKTLGAALVDLTRFGSGGDYISTIKGRNSAEHHARRARPACAAAPPADAAGTRRRGDHPSLGA